MSEGTNSPDSEQTDRSINRRDYVAALSAAATGALAGCQSGPSEGTTETTSPSDGGMDGGDEEASPTASPTQELGERVPKIEFHYWSGLGNATAVFESSAPIIQENMQAIGLNVEVQPQEFLSMLGARYSDKRKVHVSMATGPSNPILNGPLRFASEYHIRQAGPAAPSGSHYADCEATMLVEQIETAASEEKLTNHMNDLFRVISEDITSITLMDRREFGAYRSDQLKMPNTGKGGVQRSNPEAFLTAKTTGDFPIVVNTDKSTLQTNNPTLLTNNISKMWWIHFFYSPLIRYDENWNLMPVFATDWEVTNSFKTVTFTLRENAVFHDGEPITAEDVKWTFEFVNDNADVYPSAVTWPYESIETIDEHTIEFNFTKSQPAFIKTGAPTWGILPKHWWQEIGMPSNPQKSPLPVDSYVGSGPYTLAGFTQGRLIQGKPFEDHWRVPEAPLTIRGFQGQQSSVRAFRQGDLNAYVGIAPSIGKDLQELENAKVVTTKGWSVFSLSPRMHFGPFKFRELRMAVGQSLDRQRISEIATFGESDPILYSTPQDPSYPYYPENHDGMTKIADSKRANPETAKQVLRDAGWGWDDNGRLHYPPDADLSPLWPQGESPRHYPEKWPCVEELGLTPVNSG